MRNLGSIELIEQVILKRLGNRKFIEITDLDGLLSTLDISYLIINLYHLDKIEIYDIDTTRLVKVNNRNNGYFKIKKKERGFDMSNDKP